MQFWSGFPCDVLHDICTNWILVKDICNLNSAFCNHSNRHFLLIVLNVKFSLIYSEEVQSFFPVLSFSCTFRNSKFVKYIIRLLNISQMKVMNFLFHQYNPNSVAIYDESFCIQQMLIPVVHNESNQHPDISSYSGQTSDIKLNPFKRGIGIEVHSLADSPYQFVGEWVLSTDPELLCRCPNGKGSWFWDEGETYCGEVLNDLRHGFGIDIQSENCYYKGNYVDDTENGHGFLQYDDNHIYDGEWKDGERNGFGVLRHETHGTIYSGSWKDEMYHGEGRLYNTEDDSVYEGSFESDCLHGHGLMTYETGDTLCGEWQFDLPLSGVLIHASGDMYTGSFHDFKKHGEGTYLYANGNEFVGEWNNGTRVKGTFKNYTIKETYSGCFEKGTAHGQGTVVSHDGLYSFTGEWNMGNRVNGVWNAKNGDVYSGCFENNTLHGQGSIILKKSGDILTGEFINNAFVSGEWKYANGDVYTGACEKHKRHGQGTMVYKSKSQEVFSGVWHRGVLQTTFL